MLRRLKPFDGVVCFAVTILSILFAPKWANGDEPSLLASFALPALTAGATPCVPEDAYKKPGRWLRAEDVLMLDRAFPRAKRLVLLEKADRVIALLKRALPDPKGIDAKAGRVIRGRYVKDRAIPFGVESLYLAYFCIPADSSGPLRWGAQFC